MGISNSSHRSSNSKKNNLSTFYDTGNISALLENCLKQLHEKLLNINELDENLINQLRTGLCSEIYVNWFSKNKRNEPMYKSTCQILNEVKPRRSRPVSQTLTVSSEMLKDIREHVNNILNEHNLKSISHDKAQMWYQQAMRYSNNLKFYTGKKNIKQLKNDIGLIIILTYSYIEEKGNKKTYASVSVLHKNDERVKMVVQNEMNQNLNYNQNKNLKRTRSVEDLDKNPRTGHQIEHSNNAKHQKLIEDQSVKIKQYIQALEQVINGQALFENKANDVQKLNNDLIQSNQKFIKDLFPVINHFENIITSFYDKTLNEINEKAQNIRRKFHTIDNISKIQANKQETINLCKSLEKIQNNKSNEIKQRLDQLLEDIKRREEEFRARAQAERKKNIQQQQQNIVFSDLDSRTNHSFKRTEYPKARSTEQTAFSGQQKYDRPKTEALKQKQEIEQTEQTHSSNNEEELKIVSLEKYFTFNPKNLKEEFGSIAYMDKILEEARKYENKVKEFNNANHSVEYFILDENLMKLIEYLDKIKCTKEEPERRRKKNQVLKYIESLHDILDENIIQEDEDEPDNNSNNKPTASHNADQTTHIANHLQDKNTTQNIKANNYQTEPIKRAEELNLIKNIKATADKIKVLGMQVDKNNGYLNQYINEFSNLSKQFADIKSESNDVQFAIQDLVSIKNQVHATILKKIEIEDLNKCKQKYAQVLDNIKKTPILEKLLQFKNELEIIQKHIKQFKTTDLQFMAIRNDFDQQVKKSIIQLDEKIQHLYKVNEKINQVKEVKIKSINLQKATLNNDAKKIEYQKLMVELDRLQNGEIKNKDLIKQIQELKNDLLLKVSLVTKNTELRPNLYNRTQTNQISNQFQARETVNKSQLQSNLQKCDKFIEKMNALLNYIQRYGRQEQYTTEFEKLCDLYKRIDSTSSQIQNKLSILKELEAKIKEHINQSYYVNHERKPIANNTQFTNRVDEQQTDEQLVKNIKKATEQLNVLRMHIDNNHGNLQQQINEFKKIDELFRNVENGSSEVKFAIKSFDTVKTLLNSTIQNKIEINDLKNLNQDYLKICDDIQKSSIVEDLEYFRSEVEKMLPKINAFKNKEQHFVYACQEFNQKLQNTLIDLDEKIQYKNDINEKLIQIGEYRERSTKIQRGDLSNESKRLGYNSLLAELNGLKINNSNEILPKIIEVEKIINNLLAKLSVAKNVENQQMGNSTSKSNTDRPLDKETNHNGKDLADNDKPKTVPLEKYFTFNPKNIKEEFGSIAYMDKILEEARKYEDKVNSFRNVNDSVEYFILDENLMKLVEIMDKIKVTNAEPERRQKKSKVLKYIDSLHDILDNNIINDDQ